VYPQFPHDWPKRFHIPGHQVDIGVVQTPECMFGRPRLAGHRISMTTLKWLTRRDMRERFEP
jgi:uncharacterized protein (DUF433 family)